MRDTRTLCDFCGKPGALPIHHNYRYEFDGIESNIVHDETDLCHEHTKQALEGLIPDGRRGTSPGTMETLHAWLRAAPYRKEHQR